MKFNQRMRVWHRYLGFFLAGIMAVYALTGILLIFRDTDFLKAERIEERTLPPDTNLENLGKALHIRDLKIEHTAGDSVYFREGAYNTATRQARFKTKELPYLLDRMTRLHKANSKQPLFLLNVFFGTGLLFFVLSSFWMFAPKMPAFKKGMYFALAGLVLALVMIFV